MLSTHHFALELHMAKIKPGLMKEVSANDDWIDGSLYMKSIKYDEVAMKGCAFIISLLA